MIGALEIELKAVRLENEQLKHERTVLSENLKKIAALNHGHPETQVAIVKAESNSRISKQRTETLENQVFDIRMLLFANVKFEIYACTENCH